MGRGGDEIDPQEILYGKLKFPQPSRELPERSQGICGVLQSAGAAEAKTSFELWDGDSWFDTSLAGQKGAKVSNPEKIDDFEEFVGEALREAFPDFCEQGMTGELTVDVNAGKIDIDLYERFLSEQSHPWSAELSPAVAKEMNAIGASSAEVTFDGYGDSGSVDSVKFQLADDTKKVSPVQLQQAENAIADYVYEQLEARQGGWEINEGSYGSVQIKLDEKADFDFNLRVEDSKLHKVSMDPESGKCQKPV